MVRREPGALARDTPRGDRQYARVTDERPHSDGRVLDRADWFRFVGRTCGTEGEHRHGFVLMFDIQWLILVNDALGHLAGDDLCRAVADRLLAAAPAGTALGRLSGEEYAMRAPCESLDEAERLAASLVSVVQSPVMVRTHVRDGGDVVVVPLTPRMSWGVSDCSRVDSADARDCVLAADDDRVRRSTPGRPSMEQCRRAIAEETGVVL